MRNWAERTSQVPLITTKHGHLSSGECQLSAVEICMRPEECQPGGGSTAALDVMHVAALLSSSVTLIAYPRTDFHYFHRDIS